MLDTVLGSPGTQFRHYLLSAVCPPLYRANRVTTPGVAIPSAAGRRRSATRSPRKKRGITVNVDYTILVVPKSLLTEPPSRDVLRGLSGRGRTRGCDELGGYPGWRMFAAAPSLCLAWSLERAVRPLIDVEERVRLSVRT